MTSRFPPSPREQKIAEEVTALWRELHGEAPPPANDAGSMLEMICAGLPDMGYDRLRTPHLRPTNIAFPSRRQG